MLFLCVGSQIILLTILTIRNNNHTQEYKIYVENHFSLKGKTTGQTLNNFTIIKSITIIIVYVSRLNNKSLLFFFTLAHTNYFSQRQQHFVFSFLFSFPCTTLSWLSSFSLSGSHLAALSILLCGTFFFLCNTPLLLLSCLCGTLTLAFISKFAAPHES